MSEIKTNSMKEVFENEFASNLLITSPAQEATPDKVAETPLEDNVIEQSVIVNEEPEIEILDKKYKKSELETVLKDKINDANWRKENARKSQELAEEKRQWEAKRAAELTEIEAAKQAKIELDRIKATEEYAFIQEQLKNNPQNTEVDVAEIVKRELAAERAKAETAQKAQETARTSEQFWKGVDEKGDAFFSSKLEEIQILDPSFDIERAKLDSTYYNENPILKSMSENIGYALQKGITDPDKALQFAFNSAVAAQDGGIDKIADYKAAKKATNAVKALAGNAGKSTAILSRTVAASPNPYNSNSIKDIMRFEMDNKA